MKKLSIFCVAVFASIFLLASISSAAGPTLLSPPNGVEVSAPPTFVWEAGDDDVFLFYSAFNYTGLGRHPVYFWFGNAQLPMPDNWWNMLEQDQVNYWKVLAYNTTTQQSGWSTKQARK